MDFLPDWKVNFLFFLVFICIKLENLNEAILKFKQCRALFFNCLPICDGICDFHFVPPFIWLRLHDFKHFTLAVWFVNYPLSSHKYSVDVCVCVAVVKFSSVTAYGTHVCLCNTNVRSETWKFIVATCLRILQIIRCQVKDFLYVHSSSMWHELTTSVKSLMFRQYIYEMEWMERETDYHRKNSRNNTHLQFMNFPLDKNR